MDFSSYLVKKVPGRRETHEEEMEKNGKEMGQELDGNDGK